MIDEWGNEIKVNRLVQIKNLIVNHKKIFVGLIVILILLLIVFQFIIPAFRPSHVATTKKMQAQPSSSVGKKRLSPLATSSAFLKIESDQASLSAEIENADLYESQLVFPPVEGKISLEEK